MLLGATGCRWWRTENPRVGSSILSLATISPQALTLVARSLKPAMFPFCFHFCVFVRTPMHSRRRLTSRVGCDPENRFWCDDV